MTAPFPVESADWLEIFPSLLAICAEGPLFYEPTGPEDPLWEEPAVQGQVPLAIPVRARAVSMMARELTARLWCSEWIHNRARRFRDGTSIQVSNHFAFRDIGVPPGRDEDPTETWKHSALIQGGEKVAKMYLDHGPPGAMGYGIAVRRLVDGADGQPPTLATPRDSAIYSGVLFDVVAYSQLLIDAVVDEVGESEFGDMRERWLEILRARYPNLWGAPVVAPIKELFGDDLVALYAGTDDDFLRDRVGDYDLSVVSGAPAFTDHGTQRAFDGSSAVVENAALGALFSGTDVPFSVLVFGRQNDADFGWSLSSSSGNALHDLRFPSPPEGQRVPLIRRTDDADNTLDVSPDLEGEDSDEFFGHSFGAGTGTLYVEDDPADSGDLSVNPVTFDRFRLAGMLYVRVAIVSRVVTAAEMTAFRELFS